MLVEICYFFPLQFLLITSKGSLVHLLVYVSNSYLLCLGKFMLAFSIKLINVDIKN